MVRFEGGRNLIEEQRCTKCNTPLDAIHHHQFKDNKECYIIHTITGRIANIVPWVYPDKFNVISCTKCSFATSSKKDMQDHMDLHSQAKRDSVQYRYDVLYWDFIHAMAEIGHIGAEKYGDLNYQQPGLTREKSPVNHMANHLRHYINKDNYDHPEMNFVFTNDPKYHLAAIAFNAMMEYYHQCHPPK